MVQPSWWALPGADEALTIEPAVFILATEKRLLGCLFGSSHSQRDVPKIIGLWHQGRIDLERMITARRPIADINLGLDDLRASRGLRTVIAC